MALDSHWRDRVTLKMLRYFHAVASHGHFSRAAQQLNVSKSPLSAQIKELESLLGLALFERHTRQVSLTATGRLLQAECTLLFDVLESGLNRVVQAGRMERNQIRIGLVSSIFWAGFGEVIRQCHQRYPEFEITFTELSPERQKQALANKEIDLGLARFADTVNIHPLLAETVYRESMVLVVSDEHPLRDRKLVSLPELAGEQFVLMNRTNSSSTDLIINACLVEGFYPHLNQEVVEPNTLMAVVATSQQVALVPASYARQKWPHVRFIRLEQAIPADLCVLYAPPSDGQSAAIRHFIDTMSEQMNQPSGH
ncbi:LysR family transcriptional regulator [Aeromonas jandaei]|uniref:LysR family transcriptional regulator n=1 Tax=Aeromonas jandaei TaxID=650 RepID=UPI00193196F1|nr:LysR family transcriptional regulator [Aeromonas jandaei]MBM0491228.1 LysR family transcriptional regulator [Aeromonas jandaei]MBM0568238.1 LysR family transcriptional regulator [Aeromonas jandaei]